MSYRDPYSDQYGGRGPQYDQEYNPYAAAGTAHPPHNNTGYTGGYSDDPIDARSQSRGPQRQATLRSFLTSNDESTDPNRYRANDKAVPPLPPLGNKKEDDEVSGFDQGEFSNRGRQSTYGYEGNMWTKGGRGRCIGRFFCCTIMIAVFLILSIFLSLALWIRPPSVSISDVDTSTGSVRISSITNGVSISTGVNISVNNPNYFSVDLSKVKAELFYPIDNTAIGGGESDNINFPSHSNSSFTFPFAVNYTTTIDPNNRILVDLVSKCGILGGQKSDITVDYKITIGVRILFVTISPTVSNSLSFACPLEADDLGDILRNAGMSLGGGT